MAGFGYTEKARDLQARFDTTKLAGALLEVNVHERLTDADKAFIGARDMFFLSTVDDQGMPTVSYKGGATGFVQVIDDSSLLFPSYDGNGMFYSMGNIATSAKIGMLFIDFEKPFRLRVQAAATLSDEPALVQRYPGAQFVVKVAIESIFGNCPRYIHKMKLVKQSRYVPDEQGAAPLPGWKRIDKHQSVLPAKDQGKAESAGGVISREEWVGMVREGHDEA